MYWVFITCYFSNKHKACYNYVVTNYRNIVTKQCCKTLLPLHNIDKTSQTTTHLTLNKGFTQLLKD